MTIFIKLELSPKSKLMEIYLSQKVVTFYEIAHLSFLFLTRLCSIPSDLSIDTAVCREVRIILFMLTLQSN